MLELQNAIKNRDIILFIGAGVSMNLKLPSWNDLINHIAKELDFDSEVFSGFGDYLELAEYYEINKSSIGPLRSWMDTNWHDSSIKIEDSIIHKKIVDLDVPIIYTTNYDRWIEKAYQFYNKPFKKISNVSDLVGIKRDETQIIKFHGDFDDDNSIVLTESSYFDRLNFESPLDIKFRSDILGKSILFIGYSLSDINLRFLFYKLNKLWESTLVSDNRPKSYIFLGRPNPIKETVLKKRGIEAIISESDDINKGLEIFLDKLTSK